MSELVVDPLAQDHHILSKDSDALQNKENLGAHLEITSIPQSISGDSKERKDGNESQVQVPAQIFAAMHQNLGGVDQTQSGSFVLQPDENQSPRKASQVDSELNTEEMQEEEADIRRKINQKLIRNKNYFMDFIGAKGRQNHQNSIGMLDQQQQMLQLVDKRSRSETPDKMSATEVLFRAHQKLAAQAKRKESPHKLMEKHQLRQKKAEELRQQIEKSKKNWYEKIRIRQQIAKERWKELLAERKAKLQDKLEQAEERRESEIQSLKNKAKQEIQKIDEINYIVKMTMNNMKLDLNMRMNETQERRTQIMEEQIKKKQQDRALKEEAAEKRRLELQKSTETKFLSNQHKREQADQRRNQMIQQKKRAAAEAQKRTMVLQRKNDLGDKISDVMSFVNNSECIWEFLGNERDWQDLGENSLDDELIFELIQKDQIELQKMRLKKDAELLNKMIIITDDGEVLSNKEFLPLAKKKYAKKLDYFDTNSSDDECLSVNSQDRNSDTMMTPEKVRKHQLYSPSRKYTEEEVKLGNEESNNQGYISDGSDKVSIPEEAMKEDQQMVDEVFQQANDQILTDEAQQFMLSTIRLKMSMKRNILKKTLSEDLTWADFLKNESYSIQQQMYPTFKNVKTRSMRSTPERKQEIPHESEYNDYGESQAQSNSSSIIKDSNDKKKGHGRGSITSQPNPSQNNPHTSSSSNISEKSRISSVVYPSKKKKNPRNQTIIQQAQTSQEMKGSNSLHSFKKNVTIHSNQSSTNSLSITNSFSENTPLIPGRKSTQQESDSARKRLTTRLHSSSVQESSSSAIQPGVHSSQQHHNMSLIEDPQHVNSDKVHEASFHSQLQTTHTGSQMNQLIANSKPIVPLQSKIIPKKLTVNANRILFPIREQKLLMKRSGKEGQFGKFKITVKMEDLLLQKVINSTTLNSNLNQNNQSFINESSVDDKLPLAKVTQSATLESLKDQTAKKSNQNTPSQTKRRESLDEFQPKESSLMSKDPQVQTEQMVQTPTQQPSKLYLIQQKFWEKHSTLGQSEDKDSSRKSQAALQNVSVQSETSLSPPTKRDSRIMQSHKLSDQEVTQSSLQSTVQLIPENVPQMNELGYKELMLKILIHDNIQSLKNDDTQKSIAIEGQEGDKLIDYLEVNDLHLRYCRLCDLIVPDHMTNEAHCQIKSHKKTRDELGIKESEDLQFSILSIHASPGDIEKELLKEKEKALKRKVKRIKAQMIAQAVSHESASYNPGKEYNSPNKKRFQILCIDLEKQVIPIINNYEALESILKEIIKILDMRKQADLHLMRKLKFIPILIEICKRISVCHKNEFKHIGRMLDYVIKIINIFCGLRENRNYMLQTNRMLALIELLNWCLNRPTQLFYGINFLPQLFHILTLHIKHRAPYECQQMKEMFIEYLICSQITMKIKSKFQIINGPLDLSEMMGQVPFFLLKSAAFIEALTSVLQIDAIVRPVYEKSAKIGEHILFVIQSTELFGIIPMITTILLSRNQPFKPSQIQQLVTSNKVLPQTILSLAIISVKIVNNIFRMDYKAAQVMMSEFEIQEQLYHLFNYLLYYTVEFADKQEDCKELLHETLLMIGYFALNNEKHQQILCKGESTLLQKLCNLPFPYFCDKKLKEILFPTLIQASYKNDRSLAIMDQEISIEMLVDFIQLNIKEELPKIVEEMDDYHSISSLGGHQVAAAAAERRTRSPSQSSTSSQASMQIDLANGNSPYLPLYMRFPKKSWKDAITFYSKVLY